MIFGRKARKAEAEVKPAVVDTADADLDETGEAAEVASSPDEPQDHEADGDETDPDETNTAGDDEDEPSDVRESGPFDHSEVDLDADVESLRKRGIERLAFGPLIITPFAGLNLQARGDAGSGVVYALLASYGNSGLELALFAAPRSGGLAAELREELSEEASEGGGSAEVGKGPFGPEVRRVMPLEGPEGEQLFHVSRTWLVEGPRWVLRGTLLGQAAMVEGEAEPADVFCEFFRNLVVHRDETPRVPGELIHLSLPEGSVQG